MLLRNYYNFLAYHIGGMKNNTASFGDGYINIKRIHNANIVSCSDYNGYILGQFGYVTTPTTEYNNYAATYLVLGFGTGDTPVTFNDYKLASWTQLNQSNATKTNPSYNSETHKYECTCSLVLTNPNDNDVTIKEVGAYIGGKSGNTDTALVYREVLETPFTVAAGETVTYKHTLEFTFPTIT